MEVEVVAQAIWSQILRPEVIWIVLPVSALFIWGAMTGMRQVHRHQQRMAMIERGMHPDHPRAPTPSDDIPEEEYERPGY